MFRIIVISLFVANVVLVGFLVSRPSAQSEVADKQIEAVDSNIPTIHLFSEMMQDEGLMTGSRQCFSLGPFHDIEDMYDVRGRLQAISLSTDERQTQALVEKGYWVYLRPYETLLEANEVLFALQALGLNDIGVIYSGEQQNSISLGYFLRQENALRRKNGLEARGYKPLMRVQRQAEPRYWLDYEQNPGSSLIALDMQNRPNDFMQRAMPCPKQPALEANVVESEPQQEIETSAQASPAEESDNLESEKG